MAQMIRKHIYLDEDMVNQIRAAAEQEDRPFTQMLRTLCREALAARSASDPLGEPLNSGTGVYKP